MLEIRADVAKLVVVRIRSVGPSDLGLIRRNFSGRIGIDYIWLHI